MDLAIILGVLLFVLLPVCGFYWGAPGLLGLALLVGFLYLIYRAGGSKRG